MTVRNVIDKNATHNGLTTAIEHSPPYLRPIIEAVRDCGAGMLFVGQSPAPFRMDRTKGRPAIVIIGDDFDAAVGPEGFHMPSIRRAMGSCQAFAVISSEPQPLVYAAVATAAAVGRDNVMLIETRPEQEIAWLALIQKIAPRRPVCLATVKGGHA